MPQLQVCMCCASSMNRQVGVEGREMMKHAQFLALVLALMDGEPKIHTLVSASSM